MTATRATTAIESRLARAGWKVEHEDDGHGRYLLLFSRWTPGERAGADGAVVVGAKTGRVLRSRAYFVGPDESVPTDYVEADGYHETLALVRRLLGTYPKDA